MQVKGVATISNIDCYYQIILTDIGVNFNKETSLLDFSTNLFCFVHCFFFF